MGANSTVYCTREQKLKSFSEYQHFAVHKTTSCSNNLATPPTHKEALHYSASLDVESVAILLLQLVVRCTARSVVDNQS